MPKNPETGLRELSHLQLDQLRDQLRQFVGGSSATSNSEVAIDDGGTPCTAGGGDGHSSHCDSDGWA